jgi:release factor glutamine methyltransferase
MTSVLIQDCLKEARDLGKVLDAELLLGKVMMASRETIFAHPERELSGKEWDEYKTLWRRLKSGEPTAYLLGNKEFFELQFKVDDRVLIPRPETEHLVETVIDLVKGIDEPRILDVGTGCGAIALALAHTLPSAKVWASDVSADAVEVARENARNLSLEQVEIEVSDLLTDLEWGSWDLDVLVANLPYIGREKFHFVEKSVEDNEPHVALFGGDDGLRLYDQLFEQVKSGTSKPKWMLGEFGSLQREALETMITRHFPDASTTFHTDLAGLDRFFVIELNHA